MNYVIGPREISKAMKEVNITSITVAKNCPTKLVEKMKKHGIDVKVFSGDQKELGTYIGKPFPVAVIGHVQTKRA